MPNQRRRGARLVGAFVGAEEFREIKAAAAVRRESVAALVRRAVRREVTLTARRRDG